MKKVAAVGKISPVDYEGARPVRVMEMQWLEQDRLSVGVELLVINQKPKDAS